ncbi:hypothetical protein HYV21_01440 [Candidatus Microgenomates bacterium]|nr:hypothetical protein [Candidatus Microgenomates bacterium]
MAAETKPTSILAREEDGTIQLTITIPTPVIAQAEREALEELTKTTEIPGFRPGYAPLEEIKKRVSAQTVLERILGKVLPLTYRAALEEHKITPFLSPKFELVRSEEGKEWVVRATTCEAPKVTLGDYQKELDEARRVSSLWIPGKDGNPTAGGKNEPSGPGSPQGQRPTPPEKENLVIETLLKASKVVIPKPLLDEEVNHRLATLLDQTQKLGLTIEQYLASTGKTVESLKQDYRNQANQQISTMLLLSAVADKEGITVEDEEVTRITQETENGKNGQISPTQTQVIREVLKRRRALDKLTASL